MRLRSPVLTGFAGEGRGAEDFGDSALATKGFSMELVSTFVVTEAD